METSIRINLRVFLESQQLCVLATSKFSTPYTSLFPFAVTEDLKIVLVPFSSLSQMYLNLQENEFISFTTDSRITSCEDLSDIFSITAFGKAEETKDEEYKKIFLRRHPYCKTMIESSYCRLIRIAVEKYTTVRKFSITEETYLF